MNRTTIMKSHRNRNSEKRACAIVVLISCLLAFGTFGQGSWAAGSTARTFPTPKAAAEALIDAAEQFDVAALEAIFGPGGGEIIHTGEPARDREIAKQFAEQARTKMDVSVDPTTKNRAFISVGNDEWPFP